MSLICNYVNGSVMWGTMKPSERLTFAVKNTRENSGETYKLSSDVVVYIFALLKSPKDGFLNEAFC